jgi:lipid-A-disaccharide synthase
MPIIKELRQNIDKKSILVIPAHFTNEEIDKYYGDISNFQVIRNTQDALNLSDFAFVCSGTATLEAAIIGIPFVLIYKAKKIDYFIGKKFVKLKHVGLANIIFDFLQRDAMHIELIQDDLTIENLLTTYKNFDRNNFFKKVLELREILTSGVSEEVAKILET